MADKRQALRMTDSYGVKTRGVSRLFARDSPKRSPPMADPMTDARLATPTLLGWLWIVLGVALLAAVFIADTAMQIAIWAPWFALVVGHNWLWNLTKGSDTLAETEPTDG